MLKSFSIEKPSKSKLVKMNSDELTALSAVLTGKKDEYLKEYKSAQELIFEELAKTQKAEQDQRKKDDPDYEKKHQGIG